MPLHIRVNGDDRPFEEGLTVAGLLARLEIDSRGVAVERNAEVVPRAAWDDTVLCDGDTVEVVRFVGGGS
jgi:thiamine biosynthesis protein ThiS